MQIITIAVVASLNQRGVDDQGNPTFWCNPQYAPIWTDGKTDYLVSSGLSGEALETSDPIKVQPNRVNLVVGMDGLTALSEMGLSLKPELITEE